MSLNLSPQMQLPAPLEGYTLLERLGRGGFGEVWKAEAPGGLLKAIKFVFGDLDNDDEENRAARQEEKALKRVKNIRHTYILSLERYDIIDGQLVIVMELADRNLWDRFRECHSLRMPGIPRDELMRYMEETAEALDLMNQHYSIQHLDVKPQNLFLVFNHVKVGDFGLAKVLDGVRGTITGGVTPVYAGPETFNGDASRFTDQYSLAIVYQEMLTGKRPFNGSNTKQLVMQHLTGVPDLDPLPVSDREVIARGLAKDPEQRWPSCAEMIRNLKLTVSPNNTPSPIIIGEKTNAMMFATGVHAHAAAMTAPRTMSEQTVRRLGTKTPAFGPPGLGSDVGTPLPSLATPRLVTPQDVSNRLQTSAATLPRPVIMPTAKMNSLGVAEPERVENGILLPALLVGIGETGLKTLQQMRAALIERFGSVEAAPHIRFLYIDTDPDATNAAMVPGSASALKSNEVVLAKLNRPAHYIQREGMPPVEHWMPPGMLYQLPREPRPANGVRAFGRLAFTDNYRSIVQRIREQVGTFVTDEVLDRAAADTGLGARSNRARVYVIANLAGGTGGMTIDVAFAVRHELKQIGYANSDCVGMLFAPGADDGKGMPQANAYAAMKELQYFHRGAHRYSAKFDNADLPLNDSDGPFRRTAIFQLNFRDPKDQARGTGLVARSIFLDLFTPTGRRCDEVRVEADRLNDSKVPVVQPFGLYRLSWPRLAVLAVSTRRFAQRLIQRWLTKDAAHLREPIQSWLDENWTKKRFSLEEVVERFRETLKEHLREEPEKVIAAYIDPLRMQATSRRLEPQAAADVIHRVLGLVGKPDEDRSSNGTLHEVLANSFTKYSKEYESTLYNWTGWFVEQPLYRLPGAEEAVAQITERVKRITSALEGTRRELSREVYDGYGRVLSLLGGLGTAGRGVIGPSKTSVSLDLLDTVKQYAGKRITLMVLDSTLSLYRALLLVLPDCLHEVSDLRKKLMDLSQTASGNGEPITSPGPGRMILPHGVSNLEGAADLFIGTLPVQDIVDFEKGVQAELTKRFGGVVGLCTKPTARADFLPWIALASREFLNARLEVSDPASVFFRYREMNAKTEKLLQQAFEEAAPDISSATSRAQTEATILALPDSPDGERFREAIQALIPGISIIPARLDDDIVFIREYPLLPLSEVPQLGNVARVAYEQQLATEVSPHARADLAWS